MKYLLALFAVLIMAAPAAAGMSNMNALTLTPALASGSEYDTPVLVVNDTTGAAVLSIDNDGNLTLGTAGLVAVHEILIDPMAADVYGCTAVVVSDSLNIRPTSATDTAYFIQPDYPRNIVIMNDSAAVCTGTITVTGIDAQGQTRTSVYTFNSTTDSQALHYGPATGIETDVYKTVTAFARITSIQGDSTFQSNATTADSIAVGFGNYFGMSQDIYSDTVFKSQLTSAWPGMFDYDPQSNTVRGFGDIIQPATAPDAANDYIFWYRTNRITVKPE